MNANARGRRPPPPNPLPIVGAILAMGVIRLLERENRLDILTEQRVSTGVSTPMDDTRE